MLAEIREQPEAVKFLERVVSGGLTSPLLLIGQEGVGRRFSVLEATKQLFSKNGQNEFHCLQIDRGVHPDLNVLTAAAGKDIGVEAIREVVESTGTFPSLVPTRVVIIDGIMNAHASNALLKTLEEPPKTTLFFLLAESCTDVLPTIRSRCGLVRYQPLSESLIVEHLRQHTTDTTKALVYARLGNGSVGRALQYLGSGRLTLRDQMFGILGKAVSGDLSSLFSAIDEASDLKLGLRFLEHLLRDLAMLPIDPTRVTNVDIVDKLEGLRRNMGTAQLDKLVTGYTQVQRQIRLPINLEFHVKSWLVNAFTE